MTPVLDVAIVVNCYERTYRDVLSTGFFEQLTAQNRVAFRERVALVNNVDDRADAAARGSALLERGEITTLEFVDNHRDAALRAARLPRRALGTRPYFLDYGLVMPHVTRATWLLGWDAEVALERHENWLDPAIALMESDPRVFSAGVNWPRRASAEGSLPSETVERSRGFALNWNFSDQLFLVRRTDLIGPIYRSLAPAAWVRHRNHPFSFEGRVEAYQRATGRFRATLENLRYVHNDLPPVLDRLGDTTPVEQIRRSALAKLDPLLRAMPTRNPRVRIDPCPAVPLPAESGHRWTANTP